MFDKEICCRDCEKENCDERCPHIAKGNCEQLKEAK